MKLAPTTSLTVARLQRDGIAAELSLWNIETVIHGQQVAFYLYRHSKVFDLFLVKPEITKLGTRESLEEIVCLYNKCIDTANISTLGRTLVRIQEFAYAGL